MAFRLLKNPGIKLAAVVLAFLLWFHVVTDKVVEHTIKVPVAYVNLPVHLIFQRPAPSTIQVRVRANGKAILKASWQKKPLHIDLGNWTVGTYEQPVRSGELRKALPPELEILEIVHPKSIQVTLDEMSQKEVPIEVRLKVKPAQDYFWNPPILLSPATAKIRGPKTNIDSVKKVYTEILHLTNLKRTIKQWVTLTPPPVFDVELITEKTEVTLSVEKGEKVTLDSVPVQPVNLSKHKNVDLVPRYLKVQCIGSQTVISSLRKDDVRTLVNCAGLKKGTARLALKVTLPPGLVLERLEPDSVTVSVQ